MDSCDSLLVMKKNAHLKHCALISLDFSNAKRLCSFFIQSVDYFYFHFFSALPVLARLQALPPAAVSIS